MGLFSHQQITLVDGILLETATNHLDKSLMRARVGENVRIPDNIASQ
jgi:hypothetical protein